MVRKVCQLAIGLCVVRIVACWITVKPRCRRRGRSNDHYLILKRQQRCCAVDPIGTCCGIKGSWSSLDDSLTEETADVSRISSPPPPPLSILLPAYNEVHRIGDTLCRYHTFLSRSKLWQNQSDIWVIDDGSNDGTSEFVYEFAQTVRIQQPHDDDDVYPREEFNALPTIHCVTLETNQGKGAAVARGLLELTAMTAALPHQQQRIVLVADADGSGDIACLNDMWFELSKIIMKTVASMDERNNVTTLRHEFAPASVTNNDYIDDDTISLMLLPAALVVGRRESSDISFLRWWLRMGFRWTVRTACGDLGVTDSQCGFKLMTLTAATCSLYQDLHMPRWTHDVEVLVRARAWNISVAEHAVPWKDQDGSKLVQPTQLLQLVSIIWIMLWQVLRLRWEYDVTGNWRTKI